VYYSSEIYYYYYYWLAASFFVLKAKRFCLSATFNSSFFSLELGRKKLFTPAVEKVLAGALFVVTMDTARLLRTESCL
jgi:hypothetical protein